MGELTAGRNARSRRGFTLLEVMVALVILGVALVLGLGLLAQQQRVLARLKAKQEADRAVERVLEELRSGALELNEGLTVVPEDPPAPGAGLRSAEGLRLVVRAQRREPPADLFEASVEARYRVLGETRIRRVDTLFWKPGKLKSSS